MLREETRPYGGIPYLFFALMTDKAKESERERERGVDLESDQ